MRRLAAMCVGVLLSVPALGWAVPATVTVTADNYYDLYVNGVLVGSQNNADGRYGWDAPEVWQVDINVGVNCIAIFARDESANSSSGVGVIAAIETATGSRFVTDGTWRVSATGPSGWEHLGFDDSGWLPPLDQGAYNSVPWVLFAPPIAAFENTGARWLWLAGTPYAPGYGYYNPGGYQYCYLRRTLVLDVPTHGKVESWGVVRGRYR